MKIASNLKSHGAYVREHGRLKINGLTFTPGEGGKPWAYDVKESDLDRFAGVEGFSFYHDNGDLAGESHAYRAKAQHVATLSGGDLEGQLADLIRDGKLTPDMLARLSGANVVGAPQTVAPGTIIDPAGFPVSTVASHQVVSSLSGEGDGNAPTPVPVPAADQPKEVAEKPQKAAKADKAEKPQDGPQSAENIPLNAAGQPDYTNLEFVSGLKRPDLTGVAKSFGVEYRPVESNLAIAARIVEAAKAQAAEQ